MCLCFFFFCYPAMCSPRIIYNTYTYISAARFQLSSRVVHVRRALARSAHVHTSSFCAVRSRCARVRQLDRCACTTACSGLNEFHGSRRAALEQRTTMGAMAAQIVRLPSNRERSMATRVASCVHGKLCVVSDVHSLASATLIAPSAAAAKRCV